MEEKGKDIRAFPSTFFKKDLLEALYLIFGFCLSRFGTAFSE